VHHIAERWTVVDAVSTAGVPLVLVSDEVGEFTLSDHVGAADLLIAYRLGPGDRPRPGVPRFSILLAPDA